MSADKNLSLGIGLDKSAASSGARQLREEMKELNRRMLTDAEVAAQAERTITQRTNEERIRSAVAAADREKAIEQTKVDDWKSLRQQMVADEKAARAELARSVKAGADESKRSMQDMGTSGEKSLAGLVMGAGALAAGMAKIIGMARDYRQEMDKAAEKMRGMTAGLSGSRESNRELMTLEGETDPNAFALNLRKFAMKSAMSEQEARTFRLGARETGGVGRDLLGKETYDAALQHAAMVTPAVGIAPDLAGRMLGSMITGSPQLARLPQAQRVGALNQSFDRVIGTLQQAPGNLGDLTRNYQELAAGNLQHGDPLFGMFKSPEELAQVVGVTGYRNPQTGREQVEASIRALQDKDAAPLLQRAGVTANTPFQEQMARLAPILTQEAQRRNVPVSAVASEYFPDIRGREGILNQIQNGVLGGGYASITQGGLANAAGLPGKVTAFQGSAPGRERITAGQRGAIEAQLGQEGSDSALLREQAANDLIRRREIGSPSEAMQGFLSGGAFNLLSDAEKTRINERARSMVMARTGGKLRGQPLATTAEQDAQLNDLTAQARAQGFDVTNPAGVLPGAPIRSREYGPAQMPSSFGELGSSLGRVIRGETIGTMAQTYLGTSLGLTPEARNPTTDSRGPLDRAGSDPVVKAIQDLHRAVVPPAPAPLIGRPPVAQRR